MTGTAVADRRHDGDGAGPVGAAAAAEDPRFWTTEEQPERLAKQEQMAADFEPKHRHRRRGDPGHRERSGHPRHRRLRRRRPAGRDLSHAAIRAALGRGRHPRHRGRDRRDRGPGRRHLRARRAGDGRRRRRLCQRAGRWLDADDRLPQGPVRRGRAGAARRPMPTSRPPSRRCTTRRRCTASSPPPRWTRTS